MGAHRQLLAELPDAPLLDGGDRRRVGQPERLGDVAAHQIRLLEAAQLEDAAAAREDAALLIAHDEAGRLRRVVVLEQLEHEAEVAPVARGWLLRDPFAAVGVEFPVLAPGADEEGHAARVARWPAVPAQFARQRLSRSAAICSLAAASADAEYGPGAGPCHIRSGVTPGPMTVTRYSRPVPAG